MTQKLYFSLACWNDQNLPPILPLKLRDCHSPCGVSETSSPQPVKSLLKVTGRGTSLIKEARQKVSKTNFKDNEGNRNSYVF